MQNYSIRVQIDCFFCATGISDVEYDKSLQEMLSKKRQHSTRERHTQHNTTQQSKKIWLPWMEELASLKERAENYA